MKNIALVDQYLHWALVPLYRELCPECKTVTIVVDLEHGHTTTTTQPKSTDANQKPGH